MDNINIYNNSAMILNKKTPKLVYSWITILILLIIVSIILFLIPFNIYKTYLGSLILDNDKAYIKLSLNNNDFPIKKKNKLYIENDCYNYEVININNLEVLLSINLKDEIRINNNIVVVNVIKNRTTVFKIIKEKIKKGFCL